MSSAVPNQLAVERATAILAELSATLAFDATRLALDATIGRTGLHADASDASLPLLSLDERALQGDGVPAVRSPVRGADLQLVGLLGEGGMGAVYAARQRALNREVAVKRPLVGSTSEHARKALLGEARLMGALEHPNIVPVHALGCDQDDLPVLVMKRVEGVTWRTLLDEPDHAMWAKLGGVHERGLPFHVNVLMQVCNALRFAHVRGVIHRDIKPDNVMIGAFGEVYLLDWGVARKIETTTEEGVVGTPAYMAPEMVLAPGSADERTDVYLLGAVLHEVLTGQVLHRGRVMIELLCAVMLARPRSAQDYPDTVPADLAELCVAATHPDRSLRPASAEHFREALAAHGARRAAQGIAASALAKLDEAERHIAAAEAALVEMDVGVLLAETRFGLEQSLQQWPENGVARRHLQRCLMHSLERELRLRNASAARALWAALPEPPPEMETRIARLERELHDARTLDEKNTRLARDMDQSVSALPRLLFLGAFMVVGVGASVGAYLDEQRTGHAMSIEEQLRLDSTIVAFLTIGLVVMRRRLLTNAYNRKTWALWYVACVTVWLSDLYLGSIGVDSTHATPPAFGLIAAIFVVGAVTFSRPLAWVALTMGTGALLAALFPAQATLFATLALFSAIAASMEITRRATRPTGGASERDA